MKTIRRGFHDYEFQDGDSNFNYFEILSGLEESKDLKEIDVDVIGSMFSLHKDFRSLPEMLFEKGFTLPVNERSIGYVHAIWKYEKKNEETRVVEYDRRDWFTDWLRSDHYHIDIQYRIGDRFTAEHHHKECEKEYGAIKEYENRYLIKKKDEVILEFER